MKNVKKKILPKYFRDVCMGIKTFELRKDEDNIQPGDILDLQEWDGEKYTGRNVRCAVTYVLRNCPEYGLMDGFYIIGTIRRFLLCRLCWYSSFPLQSIDYHHELCYDIYGDIITYIGDFIHA